MKGSSPRGGRTTPKKVGREVRSSVGAKVLDDAPATIQELADRINDGSLVFRSAQAVEVSADDGGKARVVRVLFEDPRPR